MEAGGYLSDHDGHIKIDKYTTILNLPTGLTNNVHQIFERTYDHGIRTTHGLRALAAASIFAACREARIQTELIKLVNTTSASMHHTLHALWHVESTLDNVSGLPRMEVTSKTSESGYAVSINGKPKKMYTLRWPRAQDFYFHPSHHAGYCKLWQSYNRQLILTQGLSAVSYVARQKKDAELLRFTSDGHLKVVTPPENPLFKGQFISDGRASGKAPTEGTPAPSSAGDITPAANIRITSPFISDSHASGKAPTEGTPASSSAKDVTPASNPLFTGQSINDAHASENAPTAQTPAPSPVEIETAAKAWSLLPGSREAHSNVTDSSTDSTKSESGAKDTCSETQWSVGYLSANETPHASPTSGARDTSSETQWSVGYLSADETPHASPTPRTKKLEPVKSTLKSTYDHPAPGNTNIPTSKSPTTNTNVPTSNSPTTPPTKVAELDLSKFKNIVESYRARNLAKEDPTTYTTRFYPKIQAQRTPEIAEPSKAVHAIFDGDKVKAMKNVPSTNIESSEKTDSADGGDKEQEEQIWENVDIAPADNNDDKDWDLIDSKEAACIANREKAQQAAGSKGWTGTIRRGLFG